jgi:hypothetical protein
MIILAVCAGLVLAEFFPDTDVGKLFRHWLIELPARKLSELSAARLFLFIALLCLFGAIIAIAKAEGAMFVAQGSPDVIAWLAAGDTAAYLDLLAAAWLLRTRLRFGDAGRALCLMAAYVTRLAVTCLGAVRHRLRSRPRSRSDVSIRRRAPGRRDEEDRPAPAFAFA